SPHSEGVIASAPLSGAADVDAAVAAARAAFDSGVWPGTDPAARIEAVGRLAQSYGKRLGELGEVISAENGSPITFANLAQAGGGFAVLSAFLQLAPSFPWESQRPLMVGGEATVRHEPVGVVAAITAWNVPQMLIMAKLVPALLSGSTVVLKPAPETPLDALVLMECIEEAGFPAGVVNLVVGGREEGEQLVRDPRVDKVAFTGSTAAGQIIGGICGQQLKRCSLELGGKSAAIVLDDADLAATTQGLKFASLLNSGQACINQTRILASRANYDAVVEAVVESVRQMKVGDPSDPATEVGPMVAQRQQERVDGYIALGEQEGAKVAIGGRGRPSGLDRGWYVQPTVFAGATNEMRISREEIFGPVLSVIPYTDVDEAVQLANDSDFGLAGSVWTADVEAGNDIARRVRTGTFGINNYTADFFAPFGGFKNSGLGREYGPEGLSAYTEIKTIYPPPSPEAGSLFA
ncbi:MAG TPA: aldehyde dehydrogenase, partial [Sporichthya sp.]|nr:aldehyde dehydrogenase [Sporichthya sp.]